MLPTDEELESSEQSTGSPALSLSVTDGSLLSSIFSVGIELSPSDGLPLASEVFSLTGPGLEHGQ